MIANAAVMMLLMQENQRRGGWGRNPNDGEIGSLLLILSLMLITVFIIAWVCA